MTPKIKKLRDEYAQANYSSREFMDYRIAFGHGFDAAWAIHERLVAPLIRTIEFDSYESGENGRIAKAILEKYKAEVGE